MEAEDLEIESLKAIHMPTSARKSLGTPVVSEPLFKNVELENE